jgi:hypothetical protein
MNSLSGRCSITHHGIEPVVPAAITDSGISEQQFYIGQHKKKGN